MKSQEINEELKCFDYFGLRCNPFPVVPDVDNFYVCEKIDRIVTEIVHGIVTRKGFLVFTGEIGLGKTTISRKVISILKDKGVDTSLVFHTFYQETELLREINRDFQLRAENLILSDQMKVLNDFLLTQHRQGSNSAIIIDDAQNLSHESLELIRMISNLETDREKLVQILLVGQPELVEKLNSPELRQLRSRVMIREEASPLSQEELKGYIMFKLYMAGNSGKIAVRTNAIRKIHKVTGGNFRQVNMLMERCLYVAFLHNTAVITRAIVTEAQRDLCPKEGKHITRRLAWGLLAALVLYVTGGALFPAIFFKVPWLMSEGYVNMSMINDTMGDKEMLPEGGPKVRRKVGALSEAQALPEGYQGADGIPEGVLDFLATYGLSDFGTAFFEALETNRLDEVASLILEETGYQMVALQEVSDSIQNKYGLLRLSSESTERERHLVFWKPEIRVPKFYLGYEGEEIAELEAFLAAVKLYDYKLDGLVGPRLMRAVNDFQEANGLTVTGFPDEETIFLLCHAEGGGYL